MGSRIKMYADEDWLEHESRANIFVVCLRLTGMLGKGFVNESELTGEKGKL
jgi:hypothetical protein